ncbi:Sugar ABC transporter permease OS=Streptomyces tendae OX=1932 GN=GUR47_03730 PE=3 SV=1 [Streptomyces tendae]
MASPTLTTGTPDTRKGGARRVRRQLPTSPWLFAAPGLLITGAFILYPFVSTLVNSFTDRRTLVPGEFVGLRQLPRAAPRRHVLDRPAQQLPVRPRGRPALVLLPLLLALLVQKNIPGITFFRSAFYTPVVASIVVVGLISGSGSSTSAVWSTPCWRRSAPVRSASSATSG